MSDNFQVVLDELQEDILHPELIEDNKLHFHYKNKLFRVVMPSQKDLAEANNARNVKFYQLLKEKDENGQAVYLTVDNLKKLLKESQGIDVDAIDVELEKLKDEIVRLHLELAQKEDHEKSTILKYKTQIQDLKNKRKEILFKKAEHLAPAIQMQAEDVYYKVLTRLCTEEYIEEANGEEKTGKFIKVWSTIDEYNEDKSVFPNVALGRFTELFFNV